MVRHLLSCVRRGRDEGCWGSSGLTVGEGRGCASCTRAGELAEPPIDRAGMCRSAQCLLEPVVGVRLVVERRDLDVTRRSVQRDGLDEGTVRLQVDGRFAVGHGE